MSLIEIQNKLDELYVKELDKEKLKKDFGVEACVLSAPFLINVPETYEMANKKVLYIGKETNIWWGKLKHYNEPLKSNQQILFFNSKTLE